MLLSLLLTSLFLILLLSHGKCRPVHSGSLFTTGFVSHTLGEGLPSCLGSVDWFLILLIFLSFGRLLSSLFLLLLFTILRIIGRWLSLGSILLLIFTILCSLSLAR